MTKVSVKLKAKKIKLSRLAKVLHVTRPTLYRYVELYDTNQRSKLPKRAFEILQSIDRQPIEKTNLTNIPISGVSMDELLRKQPKAKETLIKLIQILREEEDASLIHDLILLLRSGKQQSILRLVKRLSHLVGKSMPSGKLEHEVEWLIDYITHKHTKNEVAERYFDLT